MQRAVKAQLQMQLIQLIQKSPPVLVVLHAKSDDRMQVNPLQLLLDWEPEQGNYTLVEGDYCNVAKMQLCGMKGRTGEHSVDINLIFHLVHFHLNQISLQALSSSGFLSTNMHPATPIYHLNYRISSGFPQAIGVTALISLSGDVCLIVLITRQ